MLNYICSVQKISKYWVFQLTGWIVFAFFNIYIAFLTKEISHSITIINLLFSITGIAFTHFYRNYLIKKAWINLQTEKLITNIFIASIVFSICATIVYYSLSFFFYREIIQQLKIQQLFGAFISILVLFAIWNAIYFAWNYIEKNRQGVINQLKSEALMKDLEIKAIKANLQPHFIFNSLNSIRALIDENPMLAREAITKISNILRNSISKQEETDTLANELKLVDDYLDLEKIRFEERLYFSKQIEENTLHVKVPTMMLQTLVENAIKHGISMLAEGGEIIIESFVEKENVIIQLKNTGKLKAEKTDDNNLGFGLNASRQRLHYLYNNKAAISICEKNNWVILTIKIPH
jgi:sensor histidine kinase YesM